MDLVTRVKALNERVKSLNQQRMHDIGRKEALETRIADGLKAYNAKYGRDVGVSDIEKELAEVQARVEAEAAALQRALDNPQEVEATREAEGVISEASTREAVAVAASGVSNCEAEGVISEASTREAVSGVSTPEGATPPLAPPDSGVSNATPPLAPPLGAGVTLPLDEGVSPVKVGSVFSKDFTDDIPLASPPSFDDF